MLAAPWRSATPRSSPTAAGATPGKRCWRSFGWARHQGARTFVASVSPGNDPSLGLIRSLGFEQTGEQWDDIDGLELVFEVDASAVRGLVG